MIYDNLSNINLYKGLPDDIYAGLEFLQQAKPNLANGAYQLNPRVKSIVSEYETKRANDYGYEAHRHFIDIQYVLCGIERVCCLPIPQDGYMPCLSVDEPRMVKKVVIKMEIK